jgi:hypothetical protein
MPTSAIKRGIAHYEHRGNASGVTPSAFEACAVQEATDLGDGYLLVKIGAPDKRRTPKDAEVPAIPDSELRRLLLRLIEPGARERAPEDNTALLDNLAADAMARRRQLHEQGLLLTSAQICERLGISRQALSKAVKDQRLFWIDGPAGVQWYPGFYGASTANRRSIEKVAVTLGDLPGDAKWQFFTTPKHSLGGKTPVEALEAGALEQVLRTALQVRERSVGR